MQNTAMAMNATPPMTPPIIAPRFGPSLAPPAFAEVEPDASVLTQLADAHVVQPSPNVCEQTSSDLQFGHDGAAGGHCRQRLKREDAGV